jgi:peptide/nickel transport system ATP-binding protein
MDKLTHAPDETAPLLVVEDLRTSFSTPRGNVLGVDGVSFAMTAGETLGVVGESGSGKSVLARSVMQLMPPTATVDGRVLFRGQDLTALTSAERRAIWGRRIAMVFQNPMTSLNPVMRVGYQVTESLEVHLGIRGRAARARAVELLRMVGIPEADHRFRAYPQELSGGMRQRVGIAIALACGPDLLLADEPTTALDVTIQREILDLLEGLQRDHGMGMVLITHDLGVVADRTDRVMVMYGGRVMETASTASLFEGMRHPYTAALLKATPRLENHVHSRLAAIPGLPADVVDPKPGCRFAPRCLLAQPACLDTDPPLRPVADDPQHRFACFYPLRSEEAVDALRANKARGRTAAGLPVSVGTTVGV